MFACHFASGYIYVHSFYVCYNICFVALQETEMEKLQKMKRVRIISMRLET